MAKESALHRLPIVTEEEPASRRTRARTISIRRLSKAELERGRAEFPEGDYWKPRTRAECADVPRPCPYVSCKHHLYLDVHPERGSIKLNFPHRESWELEESCSLDVAERGGATLEEVGGIMNLTRERVRQVETAGLSKIRASDDAAPLEEHEPAQHYDDDASYAPMW